MSEKSDDSTDTHLQWNSEIPVIAQENIINKQEKTSDEKYFVAQKIINWIDSLATNGYKKLVRNITNAFGSYLFDFSVVYESTKFSNAGKIKDGLFNIFVNGNLLKMSFSSKGTKCLCLTATLSIGVILLLCTANATYSTKNEEDKFFYQKKENTYDKKRSLFNGASEYRSSKKYSYKGFESSARTSEELLNDITSYGLEKSRYLYNIKEKRIYEKGISLKKTDPAHFVAVFNKQTPRAKELSRYGYATLAASSLLTKQ